MAPQKKQPKKNQTSSTAPSWVTQILNGQQAAHRIPLGSAPELLTGHREREPQMPAADT